MNCSLELDSRGGVVSFRVTFVPCARVCFVVPLTVVAFGFCVGSANWVAKQRRLRTRGLLADHRIELLDGVGFYWGVRRREAAWEARYAELQEFFSFNGHSDYRTRSGGNRPLGRWVTEQRRNYRLLQDGTLEGEEAILMRRRILRLEAVQFRWAMQRGNDDNDDEGAEEGEEADETFAAMEKGVEDENEGDGQKTASV